MNGRSRALINLLRGWPNADLLPASRLKIASGVALSEPEVYTPGLEYGPDPGYYPLREQVAQWLSSFYPAKDPISPERICISGGASQNLACILQVFSDPIYTRNVWMVAPTYYLACRIFDDAGFSGRLRAVPEDEEGIDVNFLENKIKESEGQAQRDGNLEPKLKPLRPWRKIYKHVIYAVPTFSNPSSRIMSLRRREQMVRIARETDSLIVTDDVYDCLQWSPTSSGSLKHPGKAYFSRIVDVDRYLDGGPKDGFGNAVSNGSFSKIVGPGCRTGWAEAAEKFAYGLSQTGSSRSGGAPSQLVATFLANMLSTSSLQDHIHTVLQPAYASRYHTAMSAVTKHLLSLGITMPQPHRDVVGGYFMWFTLPEPLRAVEVAKKALEEEDLIVAEGALFRVQGDKSGEGAFERDLRICFSFEEEGKLAEGIERLGRLLRRILERDR